MALNIKNCPRLAITAGPNGPTVTPYFPKTSQPADERGHLGTFVYERRTQLGLTQESLGQRINPPMSKSLVCRVERGRIDDMPVSTLVDLADALDTPPAMLIDLWVADDLQRS